MNNDHHSDTQNAPPPAPNPSRAMAFINHHSERIAGTIGLIGSMAVLFNGGVESVIATNAFIMGQIIFMLKGHKAWAYSLGALCFMTGDIALIVSDAVQMNMPLKIALAGIALGWLVGSTRGALKWSSRYFNKEWKKKIIKFASGIQRAVGINNISFRLIVIVTGIIGHNYSIAIAMSIYCIEDMLAGRIQEKSAPKLKALFKKPKFKPAP